MLFIRLMSFELIRKDMVNQNSQILHILHLGWIVHLHAIDTFSIVPLDMFHYGLLLLKRIKPSLFKHLLLALYKIKCLLLFSIKFSPSVGHIHCSQS